jgi:hypothetical protein
MENDLALQISQLSKSLEKSTQNEDLASIKDILTIVNGLVMTPANIKKSSLGSQISNLRKRYHQHLGAQEKEVRQLCRIIIDKWKNIMDEFTSSSSSTNLKLKLKSSSSSSASKQDESDEYYIGKEDRLGVGTTNIINNCLQISVVINFIYFYI